jgi:hypothetical protein
MKRERGIKANPNIDFSQMNVERFYATLIKILEEKYDVNIKYSIRKKTPEEMAAYPNKWCEVSENVRMQLEKWESGM